MMANVAGQDQQRKRKIKDQLVYPKIEKEFQFCYQNSGRKKMLRVNLVIPLASRSYELAHRLIAAHNIPCYMLDKLADALDQFVLSTLCQLQIDKAVGSINHLKQFGGDIVSNVADNWYKCLQEQVADFADNSSKGNVVQSVQLEGGLSIAQVYHALIHSSAMEAVLQLEIKARSVQRAFVFSLR